MYTKNDYSESNKKKIVQKIVYKQAVAKQKITKLIGLAGPNISDYLSFIKSMGITIAHIYEKNPKQLLLQLMDYRSIIDARMQFNDILEATPNQEDTLYDLDFDCSIIVVRDHIKKFIKNSIVTVAIRPIGLRKTISIYCELRGEAHPVIEYNVHINKNYKVHMVTGEKTSYTIYQYRDKSNMLTIF